MNGLIASIWIPSGLDLQLFSPELALIATLALLLLVPLVTGRSNQVTAGIALLGAFASLLLAGALLRGPVAGDAHSMLSPPGAAAMLVVDKLSVFFKLFLMVFLVLVTWLWIIGQRPGSTVGRDPVGRPNGSEFFVLLITSALGMALMVSTPNLLVMIIAIEMASLPSYAIVASDKSSRLGAEAALKYVLFGAATAAIMIYGVSLLYGLYGTLDIPTIAARVASGGVTALPLLAFFAVLVGIAFKISAAPFHYWCPDVFEGAPVEVTTWLSVASKAAGLGLLMRIVSIFSTSPDVALPMMPAAYVIGFLACLTCTLGNLSALRQDSVKRLLAYSSIAHAGYMMMAAAIFVPSAGVSSRGVEPLVAYLIVYLVMNLGAFGVTAMVTWSTGTDHLSSFTALGRRAPALAIPMAVCLFSLVGLPPLGGFAAKWWLLWALFDASRSQHWLVLLVMVAVLNTAISLFFYVKVIRQMFLVHDEREVSVNAPASGLLLVNICAVVLLLLGTLFFGPLSTRSRPYATDLYTGGASAAPRAQVPDDRHASAAPTHIIDRQP